MPLRPKFLRADKLVLIEGEGEVTADDIATCLRFIDAQAAHRHRKIIDARRVTNMVGETTAAGLISLVRSRESLGAGGALAVIVGANPSLLRLAQLAAEGVPADRPIRVFTTMEEAVDWIRSAGD